MTIFNYDITDGNVSFEGLNAGDTLNITSAISDENFSFLKDDDDLVIHTLEGTTIRLVNHFVDNNSRIETINVAGGGTIDLTHPSIITYDGVDNSLNGTNNDDLILSGSLEDEKNIFAYDGNDIIYGGDGNDNIYVGDGDDIAYGGSGGDRFHDSGAGKDQYHGGGGIGLFDGVNYNENNSGITVDLIAGTVDQDGDGITDDLLFSINDIDGTAFNDEIRGHEGRDSLTGRGGDDLIYGLGGNDNINGSDGDDTLYGGDGGDIISGGIGTNMIYGEAGDDRFTKQGLNIGDDFIDGGSGSDFLHYINNRYAISVNMEDGTADTDENGVVDVTFTSVENVNGSSFNDVINGDSNNNRLVGNNGNDVLDGGDGFDYLGGGIGDDVLYGSAGSDDLLGDLGNDLFIFEDSADYANNQFNSVLDFNAEEDTLDISSILEGLVPDFLPFLFPLFNYVEAVDDGTNTMIQINESGLGNNFNETILLEGYTGHGDSAQDMINEGYLVI